MKLMLERKPALMTWLLKYKIDINGKKFVIGKAGIYHIVVEDADGLKISVSIRNYYTGTAEINNVKENDLIVIKPALNKKLLLFTFLLALSAFIYGMITEKRILEWVTLLVFLGVQFYYFDLRSDKFFQIFVRK